MLLGHHGGFSGVFSTAAVVDVDPTTTSGEVDATITTHESFAPTAVPRKPGSDEGCSDADGEELCVNRMLKDWNAIP